MTIAWVIGGSGLLGSALRRTLQSHGTELFSPPESFSWDNSPELARQLVTAVQAFATRIGLASSGWEIYWAAGVGTMNSSATALAPETDALSILLGLIKSQPQLIAGHGALVLASSAGAIYAGATDQIISENTPPAPTTAYAHEKIRQEEILHSFTLASCGISTLIARISTLYGPRQSAGKQQGLITHIARCILRNQLIKIYVPLDTIRDYIAADDAASAIVATSRATSGSPGVRTKIIASEQPATIAEIVGIYKRLVRRAPRIVTSASELTDVYSRHIQFRSMVAPEYARTSRISLLVGIAEVMAAERASFVQSRN